MENDRLIEETEAYIARHGTAGLGQPMAVEVLSVRLLRQWLEWEASEEKETK